MSAAGLVRSSVVTALALVLALAVGAIVIVVTDEQLLSAWSYVTDRPSDALRGTWRTVGDAYWALLKGSLGSPRALSETLVAATPLVLAGLGVTLPFRAGLFNIGAEGQLLVGGLAAGLAGFALDLSAALHLPTALLAGAVAGAAYGAVPGMLRARTGAHEVITTIMLNYVAFNLAVFVLTTDLFRRPDRADPISKPVEVSARLPQLAGADLRLHAGILLAVAAAAATAWLLQRTTVGFELRAVGLNPAAARTAGMSVERAWVVALGLGGGLAGLGGASQVLGVQFSLAPGFSGGLGFDAITVALLGRGTPSGTLAAGILFGGLRAGGLRMQAATGISVDLVVIVQALVILFIAAPALVRAIFRIRTSGAAGPDHLATGWGA